MALLPVTALPHLGLWATAERVDDYGFFVRLPSMPR